MQINWRQVADDVILYGISPLLFTCAKVYVWNPRLIRKFLVGFLGTGDYAQNFSSRPYWR